MALAERRPVYDNLPHTKPEFRLSPRTQWVETVFENHETTLLIPQSLRAQAISFMRRNLESAKKPEIQKMIIRKIHHTYEVIESAKQIMEGTPEVQWDTQLALTSAMFHDIARFPQAHLGSYSDVRTTFNHGEEGARLVRNHFLFENTGIDQEKVAKIVEEHNKAATQETDPHIWLIRDADKKALFEKVVSEEFFIDQVALLGKQEVTKEVRDAFLNKEPVQNATMKSKVDEIIRMLSWLWGIHFPATRQAIAQSLLPEALLNQLATITQSFDPELASKVQEWEKQTQGN